MSTEQEEAVAAMNSILGQMLTGQALALRVLVEMVEQAELPQVGGGTLTLDRYTSALAHATEALRATSIQTAAGATRFDVTALQVMLSVLREGHETRQ